MEKDEIIYDMKSRVNDILVDVSWLEIARNYFHKSGSWLYHKIDGIDGNGGKGGFTKEETEQFKNALFDLSERIRKVAESI